MNFNNNRICFIATSCASESVLVELRVFSLLVYLSSISILLGMN